MVSVIAGNITFLPAIESKTALVGAEKLAVKSCNVDFLALETLLIVISPKLLLILVLFAFSKL